METTKATPEDLQGLGENVIDYLQCNLHPDDVFEKEELEAWAEDNGYVKAEESEADDIEEPEDDDDATDEAEPPTA